MNINDERKSSFYLIFQTDTFPVSKIDLKFLLQLYRKEKHYLLIILF